MDNHYLNDLLFLRLSTMAPDTVYLRLKSSKTDLWSPAPFYTPVGPLSHHYLREPFHRLVHHSRTSDFWPQTYRPDEKLLLSGLKIHWDCAFLFYHSWIPKCGSCWKTVFVFVFIFPIKDSALSLFSPQGLRGFTEAGLGSEGLQHFLCSCGSIS